MFSKGQEEAPFQLLVAVILMTFVIIVGMNAMNEAGKQKCFNDTEKAMNDFKLAIEKTSTYKQPSNIKFNQFGCAKDERFLLVRSDEARICNRLCMNSSTSCLILKYSTTEVAEIGDKCINVSYDTQFKYQGDGASSCIQIDGFTGVQIDSVDGIPGGVYQFLYVSSPGINYPVVCSYIKS